eukprot:1136940-Pelagomonas_calceolata.AAC.1
MGIWRVTGSTRLHNLAARSNLVFNSTPSGNKLVGIHNRMGMKFASKFIGALVGKFQRLKLVKGVLSVSGSTNTQKDGVESHNCCTNEFALMILDFNKVHMPLFHIQLMRLLHVFGCCGPLWGCVCCVTHDGVSRRLKEKKEWVWLYRE